MSVEEVNTSRGKLTQNMLAELRRIAVTGSTARTTANGWVTKALTERGLVEVDHDRGRVSLTAMGHRAARSDGDPAQYLPEPSLDDPAEAG